jgi:hypothetical protein
MHLLTHMKGSNNQLINCQSTGGYVEFLLRLQSFIAMEYDKEIKKLIKSQITEN